MTDPQHDDDSGEESLRRSTAARRHAGPLGPMARDVKVPLSDLDNWSLGLRPHLAAEALQRIAAYLHNARTSYDPATDKLRQQPMPAMPGPRFTPMAEQIAHLNATLPKVPVSPEMYQPDRFPNTFPHGSQPTKPSR